MKIRYSIYLLSTNYSDWYFCSGKLLGSDPTVRSMFNSSRMRALAFCGFEIGALSPSVAVLRYECAVEFEVRLVVLAAPRSRCIVPPRDAVAVAPSNRADLCAAVGGGVRPGPL